MLGVGGPRIVGHEGGSQLVLQKIPQEAATGFRGTRRRQYLHVYLHVSWAFGGPQHRYASGFVTTAEAEASRVNHKEVQRHRTQKSQRLTWG